MSKQILVNASHYETRVATLENGEIRQLHIEREEDRNVVGNIYKGVVKRVLPGMQAAFLELGLERTAFLYVDDIIDEPFGTDVEYVDEQTTESTGPSEFDDEEGANDPPLDESLGEEDEAPLEAKTLVPSETELLKEQEQPLEEVSKENKEPNAPEEQETTASPELKIEEPKESRPPRDRDRRYRDRDDREPRDYDRDRDERERDDRDRDWDRDRDREREPREEYGPREREYSRADHRNYDKDYDRNAPVGRSRQDFGPFEDEGPANDVRDYRYDDDRDYDRDYEPSERERERERERDDRPPRPERGADRERAPRGRSREVSRDRDRDRDRDRGERPERATRSGAEREERRPRQGDRSRADRSRGRRPAPRRRFPTRRPRGTANIQDLLKEGQEILVQVAKAPIGTKGARLTTHISLPGRNLVLMPTVKHLGISRRIESERERRRLRDMFVKRLRPKEVGFIIRTVAEGKSYRELRADAEYLIKMWGRIKRDSKRKRAPALIHEDLSLAMRAVRDFFTDEVDTFVIDNAEEYEKILSFISQFMPRLKGRVKLFKGPSQLFEHYGIEAEISRALGKKVWLKSGGYLLIDQSEALTAIDVNTGRYVGSKSLEETILKTNLEAVKEVSYQLRVRNVGGIIIIDLIDMESPENKEKVYRALQEALCEDKAKTNILKISDLGLVEMTRKRTHEDLVRYLTESCHYCDGRGYHKSKRTVAFEIFREIEKEAISSMPNIVVFANPLVASRITKEEKEHVALLESRFSKKIHIKIDPNFHIEQYEVFGKH